MSLPKRWQTVPLPELVPPCCVAGSTAAKTIASSPSLAAGGEGGSASAASRVLSRGSDEDDVVATDTKVELHRYAKLLMQQVQRYPEFTSVDLFVEIMLRDISLLDDITPHARAAMASWAMKLLCGRGPRKRVMEALVDAIFPAIYQGYNERKLDFAPPAIQILVSDRTLIHDNPYFSHTMYMQDLVVGNAKIGSLTGRLQRALPTILKWRDFVLTLVEYIRREIKKKALLGWRGLRRRNRLHEILWRNVTSRHEKNMRSSRIEAAFFRWKTVVEASRIEYLTERLHQAAFQLESAKNQFQMQCFRADKLQLSYEQGQIDYQKIVMERDVLQQHVDDLNETILIREKEHQDRMKARIREVVSLVQEQRCTLKKAIESRFSVEELTSGWLDEALNEFNSSGMDPASAVVTTTAAADADATKEEEGTFPAGHKFLLHWCNHILSKQKTKKTIHVSNFAADFSTGEPYGILLRFVFPEDTITLPPQQPLWASAGKTKRLRRVCEYAKCTPLAIVLEPDDFACKREDKITASVAEIFSYYVNKKRVVYTQEAQRIVTAVTLQHEPNSNLGTLTSDGGTDVMAAAAAAASFESEHSAKCNDDNDAGDLCTDNLESDNNDGASVFQDEETLRRKVVEWESELEQWKNELRSNVVQERKFQKCSVAIANDAANILRGRGQGQPLYVVTSNAALMFTSLSAKNMDDLRVGLKTPSPQAWKAFVRMTLKALLWKHVRMIASQFYHFAGADAQEMSEVQYWRFAEENQLTIEPFSPSMVMQVFDSVASPQIAAMLRTAAKDEQRMKMLEAAHEEIDIRNIKPFQFSEVLVRLAMARYKGGIIEAADRFLSELQLPVLKSISPVTSIFYEAEVQRVISYFQHDLARIFFFYMNHQLNESIKKQSNKIQGCGRFMARLSYVTYLKIFIDSEFIVMEDGGDATTVLYQRKTRFMTVKEVLKMLEVVQKRIPSIPPGELCFSLFLETFGSASAYWWPDPTVPLSRKLAAFLSCLVEKLRVVFARDTLILGIPPSISLEGGAHVEFS